MSEAATRQPPVEITPKLRRYLYTEYGMTPMQYHFLEVTGSYVSVGDHSEFEQKVEQKQECGQSNGNITKN